MKYKIGKDGRVTAKARHVILHEEDGVGIGVWVQPGAITAAYRSQDQWVVQTRASIAAYADRIGKAVDELTEQERKAVDVAVTDEMVESLAAVLHSCFVRWDDGLVEFDGAQVEPYQKIDDAGTTALDVWVMHMCEHEMPTVWKILGVAGKRAQELEGNSAGPSGGTGGTDEEQRAVAAPESTANDAPPVATPEPPAHSAGISGVPASPV
jgi:hypothetical protein